MKRRALLGEDVSRTVQTEGEGGHTRWDEAGAAVNVRRDPPNTDEARAVPDAIPDFVPEIRVRHRINTSRPASEIARDSFAIGVNSEMPLVRAHGTQGACTSARATDWTGPGNAP